MTQEERIRMEALTSTNVSDALAEFHIKGAIHGINPVWEGCPKIVGEAITLETGPSGYTKGPNAHARFDEVMESSKPGGVVVIDNVGRLDISCFGGIMGTNAKAHGMSGTILDGACRDVDEYAEMGYPVYSRGSVVRSSLGIAVNYSVNKMIQFAGVQVNPGDVVIADMSGIVFVPKSRFAEVLVRAEEIKKDEDRQVDEILQK